MYRPAELWIEDLDWHRHAWLSSITWWFPEDPIRVFTQLSAGQLEWTSVADMRRLARVMSRAARWCGQVRDEQAAAVRRAHEQVPDIELLAEALQADPSWLTFLLARRRSPRPDDPAAAGNIREVLGRARGHYPSPLIEWWELQQLLGLYEAVTYLAQDTMADLVDELEPTRPWAVLGEAAGIDPSQLDGWLAYQRDRRGWPGDARRKHAQDRSCARLDVPGLTERVLLVAGGKKISQG